MSGNLKRGFTLHRVRTSFCLNIPKHFLISSANLQLKETVGQGQHGIVYKALLSKGFNKGFNDTVAVKTLKGFFDESAVRDLLEECTIMSTFDHPNVLNLIGVCRDGGPVPYIIMPFMFNGSLLSYLMKEKENLYFPPNSELDETVACTSLKLLEMCLQVAKGMEYLSRKKVIHRDLAARNCMVDMHHVIKVCDFGLSQKLTTKDYFRQDDKGIKLPVKWMSPESLTEGVFTEKSDVWSFGVTCWEIFSCGKIPYPAVNPADMPQLLESNTRMEKPSNAACTDDIFVEVISKCWAQGPDQRPHFHDLVVMISSILESKSGYISIEATGPAKGCAPGDGTGTG